MKTAWAIAKSKVLQMSFEFEASAGGERVKRVKENETTRWARRLAGSQVLDGESALIERGRARREVRWRNGSVRNGLDEMRGERGRDRDAAG